jgi:exonuclease III
MKLDLLLKQTSEPAVICLQETWGAIGVVNGDTIKGYKAINNQRFSRQQKGGMAILVRDNVDIISHTNYEFF